MSNVKLITKEHVVRIINMTCSLFTAILEDGTEIYNYNDDMKKKKSHGI